MTHQKLQEHKRKETDNVVDKIQKKEGKLQIICEWIW